MSHLNQDVTACRICADRFAATHTQHRPRPVAWFRAGTPIMIAGQAPGMRVQQSGKPFDDRSGDRLRDWMGLDKITFYDRDFVSFVPTAFCFPGYNVKGSDLPPPPICWETWHGKVLDLVGLSSLRIIIGQYAIKRHLGRKGPLTEIIADWRNHPEGTFVLPHPSWRNTGWLKKNPWFETNVLPLLRRRVQEIRDRHSAPSD